MYHFIVNPKSSSGAGLKKWHALAQMLDEKKIPYHVYFTKGFGDASRYARVITHHATPLTLIAVGGDGTANEVINGIDCFTNLTFAYLPTGSSNDLARALRLPTEPEKALELLLHPEHILTANVGQIQSGSHTRRFIVSSGIGFDAAVCHEALHSRMKKVLNRFHLGKLTYLFIALKQIFILKGTSMRLTLDSGETVTFPRVFFTAFMNTCYEGGGFMFCPDAVPDDDLLDICLVERMPPLKICSVLPKAFHGKHTTTPQVHIYRCKRAQINTPHPLAVHTDGESFDFQKNMQISLLEEKLSFIVS